VILWRLCRRPFADLSGDGGRLVSGRWHSAGQPVVYTSQEPALAVLEVRANLDLAFEDLPRDYVLLRIDAGATAAEHLDHLPPNPRAFGDEWLAARHSALLRVPSVVVPQARNVLINPLHAEAAQIGITDVTAFGFDPRLWS
jgi:RES domain-containing protein